MDQAGEVASLAEIYRRLCVSAASEEWRLPLIDGMRQFGNHSDMSFRPTLIGLLLLLTPFVSGAVIAAEPVHFIFFMGDDR